MGSGLDRALGVGYQLGVPFRVSIVDVCVAAVVLVVVFLPERPPRVRAEYPAKAPTAEIGKYQARLAVDPGDCAATQKLTEILVKLKESDWALRVAGEGTRQTESPTLWRCFLALSSVHADRFEIVEAHAQALKAWDACDEPGADCPIDERVRLEMYLAELDAGLQAVHRGIDPRADPRRFREEVNSAIRPTRLRSMPAKESPPEGGAKQESDGEREPGEPAPPPAPAPATPTDQ